MLNWKTNYWVKPEDDFFNSTYCKRCGFNLAGGRTMSWFSTDVICLQCSNEEDTIKRNMIKRGVNPDRYEGCGPLKFAFLQYEFGED